MITKAFASEIKANNDKREIEGYAALFDVLDTDGDVIEKGAFAESLKSDFSPPGGEGKNSVKVLWQHSALQPIGRPLELSEDSKGLHFRARLTKGVQAADEALALISDEVVEEMSFGFDTLQAELGKFSQKSNGEEHDARFLKTLKLWEISPVTWGANRETVVSAKALNALVAELKAGRVLSAANMSAIIAAIEESESAIERLREVVDTAMRNNDEDPDKGEDGKAGGFMLLSKAASKLDEWLETK